jgi:hypothetical protein
MGMSPLRCIGVHAINSSTLLHLEYLYYKSSIALPHPLGYTSVAYQPLNLKPFFSTGSK